jgi:hypothetical protein
MSTPDHFGFAPSLHGAFGIWPERISASACTTAPHQQFRREFSAGFSADLSCDQLRIGQPLSGSRVNKAVQPGQRMVLDVPLIQPEGELVNVAAKVLRADLMKNARTRFRTAKTLSTPLVVTSSRANSPMLWLTVACVKNRPASSRYAPASSVCSVEEPQRADE